MNSNAPHIDDLEKHGLHYILGVKEGDHTFLFRYVDTAIEKGEHTEFTVENTEKPHICHRFRFHNEVPLNKSHQDTLVNFIEYWEENTITGKIQRFLMDN